MAKTGKTSLSDVVEELELQTEGMERQENNLRSFGEALKAQALKRMPLKTLVMILMI